MCYLEIEGTDEIDVADEKFEEDLDRLLCKLSEGSPEDLSQKLRKLRDRLVELHMENIVKINHSVMELVCAKHLIDCGYDVEVEKPLEKNLTCDLFAVKGYGSMIVEIETGFVPPEHALDPSTYLAARITSKIVRYSNFAGKFALAIPPYYVPQYPQALTQPPKARKMEDLMRIKGLCDKYYHNPPVTLTEIKNARIHTVYIIEVDKGVVQEADPESYAKKMDLI